jgi:hypothetical protein
MHSKHSWLIFAFLGGFGCAGGVRASVESPVLVPISKHKDFPQALCDIESNGKHWRFDTDRGPIHVWRPLGYQHSTAGVVIYVHGYYNTLDECWREHQIAKQFENSIRNALFIAPDAPIANEDPVRWEDLGILLDTVSVQTHLRIPTGPLVVVGHSGAIRTIRSWLNFSTIDEIILLDGLYAFDDELASWLESNRRQNVRLVMVGCETMERSEKFATRFLDAKVRIEVPNSPEEFAMEEQKARVLIFLSRVGHMEIVTQSKILPLLLNMGKLPSL